MSGLHQGGGTHASQSSPPSTFSQYFPSGPCTQAVEAPSVAVWELWELWGITGDSGERGKLAKGRLPIALLEPKVASTYWPASSTTVCNTGATTPRSRDWQERAGHYAQELRRGGKGGGGGGAFPQLVPCTQPKTSLESLPLLDTPSPAAAKHAPKVGWWLMRQP